jgi:hypothetical protein
MREATRYPHAHDIEKSVCKCKQEYGRSRYMRCANFSRKMATKSKQDYRTRNSTNPFKHQNSPSNNQALPKEQSHPFQTRPSSVTAMDRQRGLLFHTVASVDFGLGRILAGFRCQARHRNLMALLLGWPVVAVSILVQWKTQYPNHQSSTKWQTFSLTISTRSRSGKCVEFDQILDK